MRPRTAQHGADAHAVAQVCVGPDDLTDEEAQQFPFLGKCFRLGPAAAASEPEGAYVGASAADVLDVVGGSLLDGLEGDAAEGATEAARKQAWLAEKRALGLGSSDSDEDEDEASADLGASLLDDLDDGADVEPGVDEAVLRQAARVCAMPPHGVRSAWLAGSRPTARARGRSGEAGRQPRPSRGPRGLALRVVRLLGRRDAGPARRPLGRPDALRCGVPQVSRVVQIDARPRPTKPCSP